MPFFAKITNTVTYKNGLVLKSAMQVKENRLVILRMLGNRLSDFEIDLNDLKTRMVRTNFKIVAC